jgi:multicomponent K+:H+ antiporter subunit D
MDLTTLAVLPVLVPLAAIIANLLLGDGKGRLLGINIAFSAILLLVSAGLLAGLLVSGDTAMVVYDFGDWPIPFGIVFVADRLAAVMVLTSSVLAFAALLFATARWYRRGTAFFPLFHALTMGLNGAFLTGDLFNLFVFFELLLAASYGLVLHGSGRHRVRSALHYIAVNLVASSLFLIGVALIYGATGSLNMADVAQRGMSLDGDGRTLFEVGASVLGIAFLIKAGAWPLHFWLPPAYSAAAPPVAALFTILSLIHI